MIVASSLYMPIVKGYHNADQQQATGISKQAAMSLSLHRTAMTQAKFHPT